MGRDGRSRPMTRKLLSICDCLTDRQTQYQLTDRLVCGTCFGILLLKTAGAYMSCIGSSYAFNCYSHTSETSKPGVLNLLPAGRMRPVDWFSAALADDQLFRPVGAIFPTVKEIKFRRVIGKISVLMYFLNFYLHWIIRLLCHYVVDMDQSLPVFMLTNLFILYFIKLYLNCDVIHFITV
jgi:hypothetical protein